MVGGQVMISFLRLFDNLPFISLGFGTMEEVWN